MLSINGGATNAVVTVASSSACDDSGYNHNVIGTVGAGNAVTVASSTIYVLGTVGGVTGVGFGGAGSSLHLYNTLMDALPSTFDSWVGDSSATSSAPYFGNYNTFPTNMWQGAVNGTAYHPLSAWQTAVFPQDANSTTTSPTPNAQTIACTLHQIAFSGPSSGTVNTASSNFTLTPSTGYNSVGVPIGYIGTVTITPSGTGSTGLTPVTLTFNAAASTTAQTFTILPTATGSIALTESDNGATTSPDFLASTTLTYTSNITTPGAPYGPILATAGNTTATVSWSAPVSIGGSNITSYTVVSAPGNISTTTSGTSAVLTGLTNGQAYTFTITATNAAGTSASSTASNQITPSTLPSVTTSAATAITTTSVTVTGAITATNGPNPTQSGFIYTTDPSLIINISTTTLGAQTGTTTLSQSLSSLICNTTYYFEAYAANVSGTGYGTAQNFTTSACPVATVATSPTAGQEGGSVSASELARLLAPGPATTAYLESIGELPPTTATGASASTPGMFASSFTHYLKISQTGSEVKALQEYLNDNGYILTNSGPGSPGSETDMFGSLTKAALVKFQKAHGLPATGYFGPMTIGVING